MANGASVSHAIDLRFLRLAAIKSPAALTTNSSKIIFQGSHDGVTYAPIYTEAGALYTISGLSTSEARWFTLDRMEIFPYRWLKFQIIQTGGTAQAQGANRVFTLLLDRVI